MSKLNGRHILIVDDEPDLREILREEFESHGCTVSCAENGNRAFEVAKRLKLDAIISDVRMADGDGMELLGKAKALPSAPIFILMTGFTDMTVDDAYNRGADAVFSKPFEARELIACIERALQPLNERLRRRHERYEIKNKVDVRLTSFSDARKGRLLNIGKGGFFIAAHNDFPYIGDRIQFRIEFNDGSLPILEGHGICRWIRESSDDSGPAGYGIEFVELNEASMKALAIIILHHSPKAVIPKD